MGILDNLFGGQNQQPQTAQTFQVEGFDLECPICKGHHFYTRRTLLNTAGLTFLDMEWANKQADNYICQRCGHILWFLPRA